MPWLIISGLLVGAGVLLAIAFAIQRNSGLNKGIPLPVVVVVIVGLLGGGIAFVAARMREPERKQRNEQSSESQPSEAPPGMANMTANMTRMGGGGPPRDMRPTLVDFVRKLQSAAAAGALKLDETKRADFQTLLRKIADSEKSSTVEAWTQRFELQQCLPEEQREAVEATKIEPLETEFNYSADYTANPFKDSALKEVIESLIAWAESGGK
jgi:hypothetical protein